jgi:hypothetical protein
VVSVWLVYALITSAGFSAVWPVYGTFHDLQATAFQEGRLSLPIAPAKELLAAADPYDRANLKHWELDASYYDGRYYAYWGPVPALLQALVRIVFDVRRTVGDHYLALGFACLAFVAALVLVLRMAKRLFGPVPKGVLVAAFLAVAFANPIPHAIATPGTYVTAILAGQAWLLVGLVFAFDAVWHAGTPRAIRRPLVLAGVAFGLSLASRVTLAPAIFVLGVLTVLGVTLSGPFRSRGFISGGLLVGTPVLVSLLLLLLYNKLRFDDFFEFGTNLQLSAFPTLRFSLDYLAPNLYSYTFRSWATSCTFPYLFQEWAPGGRVLPDAVPRPSDYMVHEPVVGWALAVPVAWLVPLAFLLVPRPMDLRHRHTRGYLFSLAAFSALASIAGVVATGVYGATMRYLNDVAYGLVLLGLLGGFALRAHRFSRHVPRVAGGLLVVLSVATVLIGLAFGYQGYGGHFRRHRPELDEKLVDALSFCGGVRPDEPRFQP